MATIKKQLEIAAPIDRVWKNVSDLEGVKNLFSFLTDAKVDGDTRACSTADGHELRELIVSSDPALRRLVYSVIDSPFGLEFHSASWQLEESAGNTVLTWYTDVKPDTAAPMLEQVIDSELENIVSGLSTEA